MNDLVYRENVVFELYRACLKGEISKEEFIRAKNIVRRAKTVEPEAVVAWKKYVEENTPKAERRDDADGVPDLQ